MPRNALVVTVLLVCVMAAAALRIAAGPIVQLKDGDSLYALAKSGPAPSALAAPVELAVSDARSRR